MKFHKEGHGIIRNTILILLVLNAIVWYIAPSWVLLISGFASLVILVLILQFFRVPAREYKQDKNQVFCPADGKVVVIEETEETEYLNEKRIQVSIFMSPLNVHINWFPVSGLVKYYKYHPGKYLVAWHPKSSTENERTTVVVENEMGIPILFRQIAGAVARRIICYATPDTRVEQNKEFGFIKFGSRVDVFLPLDADVKVNIGDMVTGSQTVLASLSKE
ncbi:MAG: phosphatidylserine decarboxylase family protein [Cryomorphaceae bacterium]|nr:phosphatidylserine decarboxylase family protein [Flavobacteriales bacterium]